MTMFFLGISVPLKKDEHSNVRSPQKFLERFSVCHNIIAGPAPVVSTFKHARCTNVQQLITGARVQNYCPL